MWTRCWIVQNAIHCALYVLVHNVFPLASLMVCICPRKSEHVCKKPFGDAVATNNSFGEYVTVRSKRDLCATNDDQAFGFHALDHFGD